jgi:hypothetical protein
MMKKTMSISLFLCLFALGGVFAQQFIEPVEYPMSKECYLTLKNGVETKCEFKSAIISNGIKSMTIVDENGVKIKYKAAEVEKLRIKMTTLAKIGTIVEGMESITDAANLDVTEIIEREFIIYEQALLPKKKNKYALLQLVNPGFDDRIKVYENPMGQESGGLSLGGVKVTGGEEKSFLVVKDGDKSIKIKKGSYKKDFSMLFGDCTEMIKILSDEKIKFQDMALHVLYYSLNCK